jgi:acyl-coenzyme A synthetase/AMP-(fatty) acid ligase
MKLDHETIQRAVGTSLSRIHQPAETYFVESLPENATGKIDRKKVRENVAGLFAT